MCLQLQGPRWEGAKYSILKIHPKASQCPSGAIVVSMGPPPLVLGVPGLCTLPPDLIEGRG